MKFYLLFNFSKTKEKYVNFNLNLDSMVEWSDKLYCWSLIWRSARLCILDMKLTLSIISGGSIEPPLNAANRLTTCIQYFSVFFCVAITARVEAILLSSPAFWLELKNCLCCIAWTISQRRGKSTSLYKSFIINITIQTPLKTVYRVIV